MVDESNPMPTSQLVRWLAVGVLILAALGLYFRDGRRMPSLDSAPAALDTTSTR